MYWSGNFIFYWTASARVWFIIYTEASAHIMQAVGGFQWCINTSEWVAEALYTLLLLYIFTRPGRTTLFGNLFCV
jgi:hypothetical protein